MVKITLIQPEIIRGNIKYNVKKIQHLICKSAGDLLVLPEYALTGSLVLEKKLNIQKWCQQTEKAKRIIKIPKNKILIINSLKKINEKLYNICELLPTDQYQIKVYPDDTEKRNGIIPGKFHKIFDAFEKKFKVLICMDFKYIDSIPIDNIDFFIWIYHFTKENYSKMLTLLKDYIMKRKIPILASSLISDKNIGFSTYINKNEIISLSHFEGLLEIEIK